jgi:hypothetical protein
LTFVGIGCGSDNAGSADTPASTSTTETVIVDDPPGFEFAAARRCTDLINELDYKVASAGEKARLEFVFAASEDDESNEKLAATWRRAMAARLAQLRDLRVELASLEPGPDQAAAWETVVASGDHQIELFEGRLSLLDEEWATVVDMIEIDHGAPPSEQAALEEAFAALQMSFRDCRGVYLFYGNPPEHATFLTEASSACTTVVSRRRAERFGGDGEVLRAVQEVADGGHVDATPALVAAVDAAVEEWTQTLADLEAVDTSDVPDADLWQQELDIVADRVHGFERRAVALADGDEESVDDAFTPFGAFRFNLGIDLEPLHLQDRDCFAISI